jgi:hypothetical protein
MHRDSAVDVEIDQSLRVWRRWSSLCGAVDLAAWAEGKTVIVGHDPNSGTIDLRHAARDRCARAGLAAPNSVMISVSVYRADLQRRLPGPLRATSVQTRETCSEAFDR